MIVMISSTRWDLLEIALEDDAKSVSTQWLKSEFKHIMTGFLS